MPYSMDDPPEYIKELPKGAQRIFVSVFNSTWKAFEGSEQEKENAARQAAWGAVKKQYHRTENGWKPNGEKSVSGSSPPMRAKSVHERFCPLQRKQIEDPVLAPKRIAFAEVLVPWETDTQGEIVTPEEVEAAAYRFMEKQIIGMNHAVWGGIGELKESFIAREGDKQFTPGAWVMGIRFTPEAWHRVVNGELTGLSIGGRWDREPVALET